MGPRLLRLIAIVATPLFFLPDDAFSQPISAAAARQINDILAEKRQFTAAEQKMDSALIFAARKGRGELAGRSFAAAVPVAESDASGVVVVDIRGTVPDVISQVNALGGQVVSQFSEYNAVRARMPLRNLEALASHPSVNFISAEQRAFLKAGSLTSQGYIAHTADAVVAGLGITGAGVKVGVISDSASATRVAALIVSGDLPANTTVLPGQGTNSYSNTDEGAAMMEIIHDLAPGAQLFFATGVTGEAAMASNITALANAGCSIIVDDVGYATEAAFQDGSIGQSINSFVAAGGLYFSAAGNTGNLTDGTSGTWEGDFLDGGPTTLETGRVHSFGATAYTTLVAAADPITLQWSDPRGAGNADYDLFILNSTGSTVKGSSVVRQTGTQDPLEYIPPGKNCGTSSASGYCPAAGDRIVIVQYSGAARALRLDTNGGQLSIGTAGAVFGHSAAANAVSVAAAYWDSAKTGTKAFTGSGNPVEIFSSDGPRKIFYNPNGTAITPGNVLFATNGGATLQKPDLTAADGIVVKTPYFLAHFFGTSAAAPHAAAIAALVKSAKPSLTNTQIKNILLNTALDNMAPGWDRDGGFGVAMALRAVQAALQ